MGTKVRLVRTLGAAGNLLKACLGKVGVVEEVREREGRTVLTVRFAPGWTESAVWHLKPEEVEVVESTIKQPNDPGCARRPAVTWEAPWAGASSDFEHQGGETSAREGFR